MQRRTLLQFMTAVLAAVGLPTQAAQKTPQTVQELINWCEQRFSCVQGPASAYFEIGEPLQRHVYTTLLAIAPTEAQAVATIYADLQRVPSGVLFWRLPEKIVGRHEVLEVFSDKLCSNNEVQDGEKAVPPSAHYDFLTDNWYAQKTSSKEYRLRTRVAVQGDWLHQAPTNASLGYENVARYAAGQPTVAQSLAEAQS